VKFLVRGTWGEKTRQKTWLSTAHKQRRMFTPQSGSEGGPCCRGQQTSPYVPSSLGGFGDNRALVGDVEQVLHQLRQSDDLFNLYGDEAARILDCDPSANGALCQLCCAGISYLFFTPWGRKKLEGTTKPIRYSTNRCLRGKMVLQHPPARLL
jgi:hypothetical protein